VVSTEAERKAYYGSEPVTKAERPAQTVSSICNDALTEAANALLAKART
jgi:hypothetical protein